MKIRKIIFKDLSKVIEIENRVFRTPWSKPAIKEELSNNSSLNLLCEYSSTIIGYFFSHKVLNELHILNLAIDVPYQHKGFGKIFLKNILKKINDTNVYLEVKRTNLPAIKLYIDLGFKEVRIRKEYYSDGEDALLMSKIINNGLV